MGLDEPARMTAEGEKLQFTRLGSIAYLGSKRRGRHEALEAHDCAMLVDLVDHEVPEPAVRAAVRIRSVHSCNMAPLTTCLPHPPVFEDPSEPRERA